jgi:hypothetical protein
LHGSGNIGGVELTDIFDFRDNGQTVIAKKATNAVNAETASRAITASSATSATNDDSGNVITQTYANFARPWSSALTTNNTIAEQGVYFYTVSITHNDYTFNTSGILHYEGKATIVMLDVHFDGYGTKAYRLNVTAEGKIHAQYASKTDSATLEYYNITNDFNSTLVSIAWKKIF